MEGLLRGILRFREGSLPALRPTLEKLATGQAPDTLFVTCSDSRIVPNLLVDSPPGGLFTVRTVGNIVAPAEGSGLSGGDVSEAAAIEYALEALDVGHIVVCGHSKCGAMGALLSGGIDAKKFPNLAQWLAVAEPAKERLAASDFIDAGLSDADRLAQANVLAQLDNILTYPVVRQRERDGKVLLTGWWFDIARGDVHVFDAERRRFVLLDEEEADRILSGAAAVHSSP